MTRTVRSALFALCLSGGAVVAHAQDAAPQWSLAIHGGAGVIERSSLTPEQDAAYRAALQGALEAGSAVLKSGGSALDAVQAAVQVMEDDPLFNAGRGAVFTAAGRNELVAAARAVMERSPHVMLIGPGADAFAASVGLEQVDPAFFFTERRWQGLVKALTEAGQPIPKRPVGAPLPGAQAEVAPPLNEKKFGTVGAVALDSQGRLAAATSTGGMTAKRWGRVGDVPIIGAGTYASNADGCAVSATGDGEYFIRATVARDICAGIAAEAALSPELRADRQARSSRCQPSSSHDICLAHPRNPDFIVIDHELREVAAMGGSGGVIVMTRGGEAWLHMNTPGMYRGAVSSTGPARVAIYADER